MKTIALFAALAVALVSGQTHMHGLRSEQAGSEPSSTTFAPPTATGANPVASGPTVDDGKAYYTYSTMTGFFLQDRPTTNSSTFLYNETNFGLISRNYPGESKSNGLTDWQRFNKYLTNLNDRAAKDVAYKLLFIARHSEGYHNTEESYVGTPAWNCYYAELPGNKTVTWEDAALTPFGEQQAMYANAFWRHEMTVQKIRTPGSYYTSPLDRCLETARLTFGDLPLRTHAHFRPIVKELLREGMSIHTCDRRSSKYYIHSAYPKYRFEETFSDTDQLWNGITAETSSAQDYRSKVVLDDLFSHDTNEILSLTTHSGEAASLLRVLGHQEFSLTTGAIIPVFVKAVKVSGVPSSTTTMPWTTSAWCTNGPPVTSASACSCSGGVAPTTASPIVDPRK